MEIVSRNYEHFNKAFKDWDSPKGKYIKNKKHYMEEMKKGGFVPYEKTEPKEKPWIPSKKALDIMRSAKMSADKKGRINLSDNERLVDGMKSMGITFNPKFLPKDIEKGGFDASQER